MTIPVALRQKAVGIPGAIGRRGREVRELRPVEERHERQDVRGCGVAAVEHDHGSASGGNRLADMNKRLITMRIG